MKRSGRVFLVGAGPGDPGLFTRRGADLVSTADAIVVDALVNPALLREASAEIFYVGKRGPGAPKGASLALPQAGINRLLIRLARAGRRVVRLKGGDPFVFGRGSEELDALVDAGISFEIVPGVTSAVAAPAAAGIPVTDRRWASQFTIVTGREGRDGQALSPEIRWDRLPTDGTLSILMGVSRWSGIQASLLSAGWSSSTPVAAVESGTTDRQRTLLSTLGRSVADFRRARLVAPAVIVVGRVAGLARRFGGRTADKPLAGRRVAVTRAADQNERLRILLEEKGARVIVCPLIKTVPDVDLSESRRLAALLRSPRPRFDALVFVSANGVRYFDETIGVPARMMNRFRLCAVGPRTAEIMKERGWRVTSVAKEFNAAGAVRALGRVKGKTILVPRVQDGPPGLVEKLRRKGAEVREIGLYRTVPLAPTPEMRLNLLDGVDAVTFLSASSVRSFAAAFSPDERKRILRRGGAVAIGAATSAELRRHGIKPIWEAERATAMGVVEETARRLGRRT